MKKHLLTWNESGDPVLIDPDAISAIYKDGDDESTHVFVNGVLDLVVDGTVNDLLDTLKPGWDD